MKLWIKKGVSALLILSMFLTLQFFGFSVDNVPLEEKCSGRLLEKLAEAGDDELIPVVMWFEDIDYSERDETAFEEIGYEPETWDELLDNDLMDEKTIDQFIEIKRAVAREMYSEKNGEYSTLFDENEIMYISSYSPIIVGEMNKERIVEVVENDELVIADLYLQAMIECQSITNVLQSIKATNVHTLTQYGYTGVGIKIGLFDLNEPETTVCSYTCMGASHGFDVYTEHADEVLQIMHAVAPDATYYCATFQGLTCFEAIEWLLNQGCNIINSGCYVGFDGFNTYGTASRWLDHIAYQHDVHFVMPAGNVLYEEGATSNTGIASGGMAYNVITVGNVNTNGTPTLYSDDFRHSASSYNASSSQYTCRKPDICASGTSIVTEHGTVTGTSFAAPQVAGTLALMCQAKTALKTRQDAAKAILLASVNFDSPLAAVPTDTNYAKTGAGFLDCIGAAWVTKNIRYKYGYISNNGTYKSYTFNVTSSDTRIRVALAYIVNNRITNNPHTSYWNVGNNYYSNATTVNMSRLHIEVYAPGSSTPLSTHVVHAGTNVDIWDFIPSVTGTYTVRVYRDSSAETTYYGLAWR